MKQSKRQQRLEKARQEAGAKTAERNAKYGNNTITVSATVDTGLRTIEDFTIHALENGHDSFMTPDGNWYIIQDGVAVKHQTDWDKEGQTEQFAKICKMFGISVEEGVKLAKNIY